MSLIKFQRICYCTQCEKKLPSKCEACAKHPDRKPRIVEVYGMPEILATNACGCVMFRCQRPGCPEDAWFHPRADGTLGGRNRFCGRECAHQVTAEARKARRVSAPCSCGCGKMIWRPASNVRTDRVYASPLCHYKHRTVLAAERKARRQEVFRKAQEYDARKVALVCEGACARVTTHLLASLKSNETSAACLTCQTPRSVESKAVSGADASSLALAGRD